MKRIALTASVLLALAACGSDDKGVSEPKTTRPTGPTTTVWEVYDSPPDVYGPRIRSRCDKHGHRMFYAVGDNRVALAVIDDPSCVK